MDQPCFYKSLVARLPNKKQTACDTCPGNLVANTTVGECWCPRGDLIFNDKFDNCEYSRFFKSNNFLRFYAFFVVCQVEFQKY